MRKPSSERPRRGVDRIRIGYNDRPGYVYYLQSGEFVKIGFAEEVSSRSPGLLGGRTPLEHRIFSLQCGNPTPLTLLATEHGTRVTERARHQQFASLLSDREWFRLGHDLQEHINQLRFGEV